MEHKKWRNKEMFNNDRYMTSAIANLPIEFTIFLWALIDELKGTIVLDYLQIFEINSEPYKDGYKITILHSRYIQINNRKHGQRGGCAGQNPITP